MSEHLEKAVRRLKWAENLDADPDSAEVIDTLLDVCNELIAAVQLLERRSKLDRTMEEYTQFHESAGELAQADADWGEDRS